MQKGCATMVMPERETDDLVTGAQAGNSEDFAMLVQRFERQIYAFLAGLLGDRDDAWDVAQSVFLKAWLKLDTLKDASRFPTWLYAIARNAVYDHWRARKETHLSWEQLEMNHIYAELPAGY
jgi:RNA polymerase sigma-70 factor (ECF subfamily)